MTRLLTNSSCRKNRRLASDNRDVHFVPASRTPIRARPIYPPASSRHCHPEQRLLWRPTRMVVQRRCALIESASVPRIRKSEPLEVKMMAKFVAEGAHERAEGSDFLP